MVPIENVRKILQINEVEFYNIDKLVSQIDIFAKHNSKGLTAFKLKRSKANFILDGWKIAVSV